MLSNFYINDITHNSKEYIHLISEIEKRVYADRAMHLGDIDYYKVPINQLMSFAYNQQRAYSINLSTATPSDSISHGAFNHSESEETTHFSIVDPEGNAVSVTTTLNTSYGSKVFVNNRGFLLNNEMDDFSSKPGSPNVYGLLGSEANSIEPGKRMLSSMTPSIIEKNKELFLVLGTPGGSTIITSVFQTILNVILYDMDIQSAVDVPRFHHQWKPEFIYLEKELYSDSLKNLLFNMGHNIKLRNSIGHVNAIMYNDSISIGADKRGDNTGEILQ
jgi:gamma-glutamyltranspeptidase/glutathione hydrolase